VNDQKKRNRAKLVLEKKRHSEKGWNHQERAELGTWGQNEAWGGTLAKNKRENKGWVCLIDGLQQAPQTLEGVAHMEQLDDGGLEPGKGF